MHNKTKLGTYYHKERDTKSSTNSFDITGKLTPSRGYKRSNLMETSSSGSNVFTNMKIYNEFEKIASIENKFTQTMIHKICCSEHKPYQYPTLSSLLFL